MISLNVDQDLYKIALSLFEKIGIIKIKTLLAYAGGLEELFAASDKKLADLSGISLNKIKKINRKKALLRAEEELEFMAKNDIQLHYYLDANYPPSLKFCEDGPIVLYSKGNVQFNNQNIAVVGMRKATNYGKSLTQKLIQDLAPRGVQIVSGLAHGIDKEAHEAALKNNLSTVAVLGHGLDLIYPAANRKLALSMLKTGGLVTEFTSKTPGDPGNFPRRNRIVAGLADATVVVESARSGGSLITANLAFDYNREVFAFPGPVGQLTSEGCNQLIRRNKAQLITSAEDMMGAMGWDEIDENSDVMQTDLFDALTAEEERLVKILKLETQAVHIDFLAEESNMVPNDLALHLFNLQMRGTIEALPGNRYLMA